MRKWELMRAYGFALTGIAISGTVLLGAMMLVARRLGHPDAALVYEGAAAFAFGLLAPGVTFLILSRQRRS